MLESPRQRIAAALTTLASIGLSFLPLFGGPGYEFALVTGLYLPGLVAIATALDVLESRPLPLSALARGATSGVAMSVLAWLISWIAGLFGTLCDFGSGTALFVLGPALGTVLGGFWGACVGLATESVRSHLLRRVVCVILSVGAPLATILVSLGRFYTSPMVFAFDPFFGHFAGPLYDTVIDPLETLATYRLGTVCTMLSVLVGFCHVRRDEKGELSLFWPGRPALSLLGAAALVLSLAHSFLGARMGHFSTAKSVQKALGRAVSGDRCDVVYSARIRAQDAEILARECERHVPQLERFLGVEGPRRIRVLLFADAAEKARLMGASNTYIAKPWRREVYLQAAGFPHRVLGHELAHVIAGGFGTGPFKVSGPLGGWVPDPGRIEGLAVAAAPPEDSELTLQQWSRAMQQLQLLPALSDVFRLSFLGEPASKAYTVAGAFIQFLAKTRGMDAVRKWYAGMPMVEVSGGQSLSVLERAWHASLKSVPLDRRALETAKSRFDRPAIFERSCPHRVDRLNNEAYALLQTHDIEGARQRFSELLELDPHHFSARYGLATCELRKGDAQAAAQGYRELGSAEDLNQVSRTQAEEAAADVLFIQGKRREAAAAYKKIEASVFDEDRSRTLDVKRSAAEAPDSDLGRLARDAISALLLGSAKEGPSWDLAAVRLGVWSGRDAKHGLADYLIGKNLFQRGHYAAAARHLDLALTHKLALPRVLREARRVRVLVGCALGQRARSRQVYGQLLTDQGLSAAAKAGFERMAERCQITDDKASGITSEKTSGKK